MNEKTVETDGDAERRENVHAQEDAKIGPAEAPSPQKKRSGDHAGEGYQNDENGRHPNGPRRTRTRGRFRGRAGNRRNGCFCHDFGGPQTRNDLIVESKSWTNGPRTAKFKERRNASFDFPLRSVS